MQSNGSPRPNATMRKHAHHKAYLLRTHETHPIAHEDFRELFEEFLIRLVLQSQLQRLPSLARSPIRRPLEGCAAHSAHGRHAEGRRVDRDPCVATRQGKGNIGFCALGFSRASCTQAAYPNSSGGMSSVPDCGARPARGFLEADMRLQSASVFGQGRQEGFKNLRREELRVGPLQSYHRFRLDHAREDPKYARRLTPADSEPHELAVFAHNLPFQGMFQNLIRSLGGARDLVDNHGETPGVVALGSNQLDRCVHEKASEGHREAAAVAQSLRGLDGSRRHMKLRFEIQLRLPLTHFLEQKGDNPVQRWFGRDA
eukprot:scaffold442_cov268-Pinguiococcus_pyrenoidosus.AAC.2